jgi:thiaminase
VGQSEDWFALQIAVAPCLIGYGFIGARLFADPMTKREDNRYWKWIDNYAAEYYQESTRVYRGKYTRTIGRRYNELNAFIPLEELLEEHATKQSPSRIEELVKIFIHATRVGSF